MNRELNRWQEMMDYCYDKQNALYHFHGKHGVTVAPSWHTFEGFIRDVGPMPGSNSYLDRTPGSIQFNKETTGWRHGLERELTLGDKTWTLTGWSLILKIPKATITARIRRNLPMAEVLATHKLRSKTLLGVRFGKLVVIGHAKSKDFDEFWYCRCECRRKVRIAEKLLRTNRILSCGCTKYVEPYSVHTRLTYMGKRLSILGWSKATLLPASLIVARIKELWSIGQALGFEIRPKASKGTRRLSLLSGVAEATIAHRKSIGVHPDDLTKTASISRAKLWEHDGLTMSLNQWATYLGESEAALRSRLHSGWSFEEAIKIPTKPKE